MSINIHQGEAVDRDEQWWGDEKRNIDDARAQYPICEIVGQMARRIAYQTILMEGDPTLNSERTKSAQIEMGKRVLPTEWLAIADEWCRDHGLHIGHGIMALLHFRSLYGGLWDGLELRMILDDAIERAKDVEIFR